MTESMKAILFAAGAFITRLVIMWAGTNVRDAAEEGKRSYYAGVITNCNTRGNFLDILAVGTLLKAMGVM